MNEACEENLKTTSLASKTYTPFQAEENKATDTCEASGAVKIGKDTDSKEEGLVANCYAEQNLDQNRKVVHLERGQKTQEANIVRFIQEDEDQEAYQKSVAIASLA